MPLKKLPPPLIKGKGKYMTGLSNSSISVYLGKTLLSSGKLLVKGTVKLFPCDDFNECRLS
jgi:hypothetical protein